MPTRVDYPIPPPTTWEAFENLCRDLWAEIWNYNNTLKNGRQGQRQHGVDVFGEPKKNYWAGVQAKEKDQLPGTTLTIDELHKEVNKAKNFKPALSEYIVATTGPRDAQVQEEARKITEENRKNGLFDVVVYSWKDIESLLKKHQNVYRLHYPEYSRDLDTSESLTQQVKKSFETSSEEISGLKFEIKSEFKHLSEQISIGGDVTQEHHVEIDYARDLIDQHKPASALSYLEPIKDRIWNQTNPSVKFRLLTNIAAAKLEMGDEKEAAKLFIEAFQYNPDEEKALCNIALAYILLNKPKKAEEYVKKVLSKNPASGRTYSMLIQIRSDSSTPIEKIISEIPSEYHDLPEVAYALGTVCRRSQHFQEALDWFERAGTAKNMEPEYLVSQATTLLASISTNMHLSFSKRLTKEEHEKVKDAVRLFEQAWEEIRSYEDKSLKIECLTNKGISYMLLGDTQKAAISFDDALVIEPDNPNYIFNRAFIDYESGKKDLALERIKKIADNPELPAAILIGDIYLSSNNLEILRKEALPVVEKYIKLNPPLFLKGAAERLLIQIHVALNELKEAAEISDELVEQNPKDINSLVSQSRVYRLLNNEKIADNSLTEAEKLVSDDITYFDLLALADEYNFIGKFGKASTFYEQVTDIRVDGEITRRLIDTYLKSGNNQKALFVCQSIRINQGLIREIVELEATLYEDIGDLANAAKLCEEYLKENPNDERVKLHLATINFRSQKLNQVDEFLKEPLDYEKLSLRYRIQYVKMLVIRGFNKEAINVMYETRRKFFHQSEAHLQYITTLLKTEERDDKWIYPDKVSDGTAVLLEDKNGTKTCYLIEDRVDTDFAKNELKPSHPLAQKMLGKKKGDEIELVSSGPQKQYGKIIEIKNKYIYALHNSMNSYQTMFPEADGLYRIDLKSGETGEIEKEDLKIIFEQIDTQQEHYSQVMNLYKEGRLTVGSVAKMLGRSEVEAWGLLTSQEEPGLKSSLGDVNLRKTVQENLSVNPKPKMVIDIFALLTIHGLKTADIIERHYGKFLISQSTLDVLTELITNRKGIQAKGFLTVGKKGDQYIKEEITADQLKKNTDYLKGILKWIKEKCIITPCHEALRLESVQREELYRLFGISSIDSILIAKQEKALLYSDDERLRSFATSSYQVQGVWTQAVIENLLNSGIISNEKYQDFLIQLVNSNYIFTSINSDTLIEATKQSQWRPDRNFMKIVSLLTGKKCDDIPAIIVVSDYMQKLLNQPIFIDDPKNMCFIVLDTAIKDRDKKGEFIKRLEVRLNKLFTLSPTQLSEIKQILGAWLKTQII